MQYKLAILLFIISLTLLSSSLHNSRVYNQKKPNEIINIGSVLESKEIVGAGLQVLGIKGVKVIIVDLALSIKDPSDENFTIEEAFIVNPMEDHFTIFFNPKNDIDAAITILAHELIHLKQFYDGRLKILEDQNVVFNEDTLQLKGTSYMQRG